MAQNSKLNQDPPKHLLFQMDSQQQEDDIIDINEQLGTKVYAQTHIENNKNFNQLKITEINSVNAFKTNIQNNQIKLFQDLSYLKQSKPFHASTPQKNHKKSSSTTSLPKKQNLLQQQIILSNLQQTLSNQKSIDSMSGSVINFLQNKNGSSSQRQLDYGQFSKDNDEQYSQQKNGSPHKLKGIKSGAINKHKKLSLLNPQIVLKKQCYNYLNNTFEQIKKEQNNQLILRKVIQFLHTPLPSLKNSYMRYIFEVIFYKYTFTFHSQYEFYLRNQNGELIQLLKSQKDSFTVSSSHMLYATNPHQPKSKIFTGKLKYNTVKSEYNLYDIDQKQINNQQRMILATGFYDKSIGEDRNIDFYIPKEQYFGQKFGKSQNNKNLLSYYDQAQKRQNRKIQRLKTTIIPKSDQQDVRKQFSLKNQGRRIMVTNQQGEEAFYMGKRQNQRYIILSSAGLTPLQIFTLAIINLDH